jgi:hypothetical protein
MSTMDATVPQPDAAATELRKDAAQDHDVDSGAAPGHDLDAGAEVTPHADARLCMSCGGCEEVQTVQGSDHTSDPVNYPDPPPTSGPHNPCWITWGVHDTTVPTERWVHNLEHGGVVYLYNCPAGCPAEVATLTQLVNAQPRTVLTPYAGMTARFAVVSWGHRLVSDCIDPDVYTKFYAENFDHGSEQLADNPPASCPP